MEPKSTTPPYTGLVYRQCGQPVAVLAAHGERVTGSCPSCGYSWMGSGQALSRVAGGATHATHVRANDAKTRRRSSDA